MLAEAAEGRRTECGAGVCADGTCGRRTRVRRVRGVSRDACAAGHVRRRPSRVRAAGTHGGAGAHGAGRTGRSPGTPASMPPTAATAHDTYGSHGRPAPDPARRHHEPADGRRDAAPRSARWSSSSFCRARRRRRRAAMLHADGWGKRQQRRPARPSSPDARRPRRGRRTTGQGHQTPGTRPGGVPDDWERVNDPEGFSLALPKGWKRSDRGRPQIDYTPDSGEHFVRIAVDDSPDFDTPYAHLLDLEEQLRGGCRTTSGSVWRRTPSATARARCGTSPGPRWRRTRSSPARAGPSSRRISAVTASST